MKLSLLLASASLLAFATAAHASDLMVDGPGPIQYTDTTAHNWDGGYVGVLGGFSYVTAETPDEDVIFNGDSLSGTDAFVGVTAGVNFALGDGGVVVGVAGDLTSGPSIQDLDFSTTVDIQWAGSVRGVVGFDAGAFMPYLTAGLAVAGVHAEYFPDGSDNTMYGWTAGAGVAYAVADNVSVDLQYRYSDYGTAFFETNDDTDISVTTHQVTAGVNFKF